MELNGDIGRRGVADKATAEEIRMFDVVPDVFPDLLLRVTLLVDATTMGLEVRTVNDGEVCAGLLGRRDQARHSGII